MMTDESSDYTSPTVSYTDELVAQAHAGQKYGDEPYVEHVRRVAKRLVGHGEWAYMAGLLHDAVEDTAITLDLLRELGYPQIVVAAVDAVTWREGEDYFDRVRIAAAHPLGCCVKIADNQDNRAMLPHLQDAARRERLQQKYLRASEILMSAYVEHAQACRTYGPRMPAQESTR